MQSTQRIAHLSVSVVEKTTSMGNSIAQRRKVYAIPVQRLVIGKEFAYQEKNHNKEELIEKKQTQTVIQSHTNNSATKEP